MGRDREIAEVLAQHRAEQRALTGGERTIVARRSPHGISWSGLIDGFAAESFATLDGAREWQRADRPRSAPSRTEIDEARAHLRRVEALFGPREAPSWRKGRQS